jgi:hypothetical protein
MAEQPQTTPTKQQAKQQDKKNAGSTQAYLNISEVKDGVVVHKDGSLRAVLLTSAVNFALKSGDEQDAIIYAYQRFLNSLSFPVQILVQSRRLDLEYYLEKLQTRADEQTIELVKLQTMEYTEFIKRLISVTNIMDKRFFVVVPFYPTGTQQAKGGFSKLFSTTGSKKQEQKNADEMFEQNKVQLMQRVEALASGLGGIGLRAVSLNSEELVELFYSIYNPSTATKQRLLNVDELTAASIEKVPGGSGPPPIEPLTPDAEEQREVADPLENPAYVESAPAPQAKKTQTQQPEPAKE